MMDLFEQAIKSYHSNGNKDEDKVKVECANGFCTIKQVENSNGNGCIPSKD